MLFIVFDITWRYLKETKCPSNWWKDRSWEYSNSIINSHTLHVCVCMCAKIEKDRLRNAVDIECISLYIAYL